MAVSRLALVVLFVTVTTCVAAPAEARKRSLGSYNNIFNVIDAFLHPKKTGANGNVDGINVDKTKDTNRNDGYGQPEGTMPESSIDQSGRLNDNQIYPENRIVNEAYPIEEEIANSFSDNATESDVMNEKINNVTAAPSNVTTMGNMRLMMMGNRTAMRGMMGNMKVLMANLVAVVRNMTAMMLNMTAMQNMNGTMHNMPAMMRNMTGMGNMGVMGGMMGNMTAMSNMRNMGGMMTRMTALRGRIGNWTIMGVIVRKVKPLFGGINNKTAMGDGMEGGNVTAMDDVMARNMGGIMGEDGQVAETDQTRKVTSEAGSNMSNLTELGSDKSIRYNHPNQHRIRKKISILNVLLGQKRAGLQPRLLDLLRKARV